jgi:hypothetical protein
MAPSSTMRRKEDPLCAVALLLRFVRLLIQRRLVRDVAEEPDTETLIHRLRKSSKSWHGVKLNQPDWSAEIVKNRVFIHWILNTLREPLDFELPTDCGRWSAVDRYQPRASG